MHICGWLTEQGQGLPRWPDHLPSAPVHSNARCQRLRPPATCSCVRAALHDGCLPCLPLPPWCSRRMQPSFSMWSWWTSSRLLSILPIQRSGRRIALLLAARHVAGTIACNHSTWACRGSSPGAVQRRVQRRTCAVGGCVPFPLIRDEKRHG